MPKMDGIEVCQRLKGDAALPFMPIIMVTAGPRRTLKTSWPAWTAPTNTSPNRSNTSSPGGRVKSMLRIKELHDTVRHKPGSYNLRPLSWRGVESDTGTDGCRSKSPSWTHGPAQTVFLTSSL